MNKSTAFILLSILLPSLTFTQQYKIQGKVTDTQGGAIISATIVLVEAQDSSKILSFAISDTEGKYELRNIPEAEQYILTIRSMGYKPLKEYIVFTNNHLTLEKNFVLEENISEMQEIVFEAEKSPFEIHGDTVSYNISAYQDGSERKVEDILKKLPGIQVDEESGQISYKGKTIETVMLEGDNLFDYNYTLGTKNINIDMVEQVQAIENYSDNPLLKGLEVEDKVALNLKLKKGKVDFSGSIDSGIGINAEEKAVADIDATLLGISKSYKSFGIVSYNNIGNNNTPFDYFGFDANVEEIEEEDYFASKIIPEAIFSSDLDEKRVNINNQIFGNYNALFRINKRLSIKSNLYYIHDNIRNEQFLENQYNIDNDNFSTTDDSRIEKKPLQYRGDLEMKYNSSEHSLLEYKLKIRQEDIFTNSSLLLNQENLFENELNSQDFYMKQKLLFTQKISKNLAFQANANYSHNRVLQNYSINPSLFPITDYTTDIQSSNPSKTIWEISSSVLGRHQKNKYTLSLGMTSSNYLLESQLRSISENGNDIVEVSDSKNDLNYTQNTFYNSASYRLIRKKWSMIPSYSMKILRQNLDDKMSQTQSREDFTFEPNLTIEYKLNEVSSVSGSIGYTQNSLANNYLFSQAIFIDNRTNIRNEVSLNLQNQLSYGLVYHNNDIYNQFELNLGINYQQSQGNFFSNAVFMTNSTQINYFFLPEDNNNLSFHLFVAKYIPFLSSTMKLTSNISFSEYKNIVNDSELRTNSFRFSQNELFFKTAFDSFINFENILAFSQSQSEGQGNGIFINNSLNNSFKLILKPSKQLYLMSSVDYFLPNTHKTREYYTFLDFTLRYKPQNKNYELHFVGKNLLNQNNFVQIETSDYATSFYQTNLLARYFLIELSFSF